jgi:hypothetical protein
MFSLLSTWNKRSYDRENRVIYRRWYALPTFALEDYRAYPVESTMLPIASSCPIHLVPLEIFVGKASQPSKSNNQQDADFVSCQSLT